MVDRTGSQFMCVTKHFCLDFIIDLWHLEPDHNSIYAAEQFAYELSESESYWITIHVQTQWCRKLEFLQIISCSSEVLTRDLTRVATRVAFL